ncbi:MAG: right-handed parallel beta-helix repeat-containing protein [Opitutales bacterium]|jgi:hypothetical protein|nr:right-handed parallel beta-helix repeat-containing protein [Opitutales bacterium]
MLNNIVSQISHKLHTVTPPHAAMLEAPRRITKSITLLTLIGSIHGLVGSVSTEKTVETESIHALVDDSPSATTVDSLSALKPYLDDDNVHVKLLPGTYTITEEDVNNGLYPDETDILGRVNRVFLLFSGNNSTYDFTGVTLNIETAAFRAAGIRRFIELQIIGNGNVLKNLTMVDVGTVDDAPNDRGTNIVMDGSRNRIEGFHMTIKGSYPYGYGDAFGKGGNTVIKHRKHSALLIRGDYNHIKGCTLIHRSYGHGIFMQAANNPTIEDCYVEGETRTTDEMLLEEGTGSPADLVDFKTIWGYRLPKGYTKSTGEAGIRAYNAGETIIDGVEYSRGTNDVTVLNCRIKDMRVGVTLTHARGKKYVEGCEAIGTERGYAIGSGDIVNCSADVQHGPAFGVDYERDSGVNADITILPHGDPNRGNQNGSKHVAYITGKNHNLTFRTTATNFEQELIINVGGDRRIISSVTTVDDYLATNMTINNYTGYPMVLGGKSSDIVGLSGGSIADSGSDNSISAIDFESVK